MTRRAQRLIPNPQGSPPWIPRPHEEDHPMTHDLTPEVRLALREAARQLNTVAHYWQPGTDQVSFDASHTQIKRVFGMSIDEAASEILAFCDEALLAWAPGRLAGEEEPCCTLHPDEKEAPAHNFVPDDSDLADSADRCLTCGMDEGYIAHVNPFCSNRSEAGDACGACPGCLAEVERLHARQETAPSPLDCGYCGSVIEPGASVRFVSGRFVPGEGFVVDASRERFPWHASCADEADAAQAEPEPDDGGYGDWLQLWQERHEAGHDHGRAPQPECPHCPSMSYCPEHGWQVVTGHSHTRGPDPYAVDKLVCGHSVIAFGPEEQDSQIVGER